MADSKENYWLDFGSKRVYKISDNVMKLQKTTEYCVYLPE